MRSRFRDPPAEAHFGLRAAAKRRWDPPIQESVCEVVLMVSVLSHGAFPKLGVPFWVCPFRKDYSILGSTVGPIILGNYHIRVPPHPVPRTALNGNCAPTGRSGPQLGHRAFNQGLKG